MAYSNAQILAAVVSHWARPAITQIAMSKLAGLPLLRSIQQAAVGMGLVGGSYNIMNDLQLLVQPALNNILQPYLERQFSQLPDEALPGLARDIIAEAQAKGSYSLMEGLVIFDGDDIAELGALIEKNLPEAEAKGYEVKL